MGRDQLAPQPEFSIVSPELYRNCLVSPELPELPGTQNQMEVAGHQHPAPHRHPMCSAVNLEKIAVSSKVRIAKKGLLTTVATLGDMMGNARKNKSGKSGHQAGVTELCDGVN